MPDPAEDFGAGIVPPEAGATTSTTNLSRALIEQLRAKELQIPDEWDDSTLVDNLLENQRLAQEAEALRAENAAFKGQQAQVIAEQAAAMKAKPGETPAETRKRLYEEGATFDENLLPLVTPASDGYGYAAKNPLNAAHVAAAQQINETLAKQQKFTNDLRSRPYATARELVQEILDERDRELKEWQKGVEGKLTPLEEQRAQSLQTQQEAAFAEKHAEKLFVEGGGLTPVGQLTNNLYMKYGVPLEDALKEAEATFGEQVPVTPQPAPKQSISKVAKPPTGQQPNSRFVDRLSQGTRDLVNKPESEAGEGKKRMTEAELDRKYGLRRN